MGFHRIVQTPLTLSDGLQLPARTHICTAAYAISNDPANLSNAQDLNGFRYYEKRKQPDEEYRHQYAVMDKDHMHFGHGRSPTRAAFCLERAQDHRGASDYGV